MASKLQDKPKFYWQSVNIGNKQRGYVKVDKDGIAQEVRQDGAFKVYYAPDGEWFWSEKDTSHAKKPLAPQEDLSTYNTETRSGIIDSKIADLNNQIAEAFKTTPDSILRDYQLRNQQGSTVKSWWDSSGNQHTELGEHGMSGNDPLGEFYVAGAILGKPLQAIGSKLLGRTSTAETSLAASTREAQTEEEVRRLYRNMSAFIRVPNFNPSTDIPTTIRQEMRAQGFTPIGLIKPYPGNIDFTKELLRRLKANGVDIEASVPGGSKTIKQHFIDQTSKNTYIGYNRDSRIAGWYSPRYDISTFHPRQGSNKFLSTVLHERVMHPTDDLIDQMGQSQIYKDLISSIFKNTSVSGENYVIYGRMFPKTGASNSWKEIRATLGEYAQQKYVELLNKKGLPNLNKIQDYIDEFNIFVDRQSLDSILQDLRNINGYGYDYRNIISALSNAEKVEVEKLLKTAIKTAAMYNGAAILTEE